MPGIGDVAKANMKRRKPLAPKYDDEYLKNYSEEFDEEPRDTSKPQFIIPAAKQLDKSKGYVYDNMDLEDRFFDAREAGREAVRGPRKEPFARTRRRGKFTAKQAADALASED